MTKSRNLITPRYLWQPWQIAIVVCCYECTANATLSKLTGASVKQIYSLASRYGLKKSAWFYKHHPSSGSLGTNPQRGASSRFVKGHTSWNKGIKGICAPGSEKGWFAKGSQPHNTAEVGAYRITKDGTLQQKISNKKGNNSMRWRGVHELVWKEVNGSIPPKHICVFKPGMRTNVLQEITLDKIECISLAENCKRNSVHRNGPEIAKAYQLLGQINRQINKRENHGKRE